MRSFWFYMPLCYHAACYTGLLMSDRLDVFHQYMSIFFLADIFGIMIVPLYLSVLAVVNAFMCEGKVFSSLLRSSVIVLIIGAARTIIYCAADPSGLLGCVKFTVYTFAILIVWFLIFELTNYLMHKRRRF